MFSSKKKRKKKKKKAEDENVTISVVLYFYIDHSNTEITINKELWKIPLSQWTGRKRASHHELQSNVTYPDATYPSTSDIRLWGVLNNFDSLTDKS